MDNKLGRDVVEPPEDEPSDHLRKHEWVITATESIKKAS